MIARSGRWVAALSLAAALGALALGLGAHDWPILENITNLNGHLIGMAIAAAAALLIPKRAWTMLIGGGVMTLLVHIGLSLGIDQIEPRAALASIGMEAGGKTRGQNQWKVISLNSWHSNAAPERIVDYLRREQADVVVLSEFGPSKRHLLRQLQGDYPHQVDCAKNWYCSLALLSRHPMIASGARTPTRKRPSLVWARFAGPGARARAAPLTVIGTHIYRPSKGPRLHRMQMDALAAHIKAMTGSVVLVGDFNATPWSSSYQSLVSDSGLKPAGLMVTTWPAWPLRVPQFAIDHLFVSKDIEISAQGAGPMVGSDHLPIWGLIGRRP